VALPTVIDTILLALAPAMPDRVPAGHKGEMGGCSFYGYRKDTGARFLLMNIFGGGWGGRPHEDGEDASVSICQGDVRNTPVELQEIHYPVLVECHQLRADSGGAGKHRGGLGVELRYRALQTSTVNVNMERTYQPPWGLDGGKPGATNKAIIKRTDGSERVVQKETNIPLSAGDTVTFLTAGGGGYGDPKARLRGCGARLRHPGSCGRRIRLPSSGGVRWRWRRRCGRSGWNGCRTRWPKPASTSSWSPAIRGGPTISSS
jgi:N-methylhydantoinase B